MSSSMLLLDCNELDWQFSLLKNEWFGELRMLADRVCINGTAAQYGCIMQLRPFL